MVCNGTTNRLSEKGLLAYSISYSNVLCGKKASANVNLVVSACNVSPPYRRHYLHLEQVGRRETLGTTLPLCKVIV